MKAYRAYFCFINKLLRSRFNGARTVYSIFLRVYKMFKILVCLLCLYYRMSKLKIKSLFLPFFISHEKTIDSEQTALQILSFLTDHDLVKSSIFVAFWKHIIEDNPSKSGTADQNQSRFIKFDVELRVQSKTGLHFFFAYSRLHIFFITNKTSLLNL